MAPKTKDQLKIIKLEKRKQIMQAALEVFATHGYHGASISHIATTAGVAKGLIYSYFESKEQMLKAIMVQGIENLVQIFSPALNQDLTPQLFRDLVQKYFDVLKNNLSFWRLYFSIALQPNVIEMLQQELSVFSEKYSLLLHEYYKKQGSKNPEADSLMTHALLDGITLNFIMNHHDMDTDLIQNIAIEQIIKSKY